MMDELIPAAPEEGRLTIYYRTPFTVQHWPFVLKPGAWVDIYPTAGYEVDHFSIAIIPPEVPDGT